MSALVRKCPVRGCETHIPAAKLMCAAHWRCVTLNTQCEVLTAHKQAPLSRRHADAMAQAIREAVRPVLAPSGAAR